MSESGKRNVTYAALARGTPVRMQPRPKVNRFCHHLPREGLALLYYIQGPKNHSRRKSEEIHNPLRGKQEITGELILCSIKETPSPANLEHMATRTRRSVIVAGAGPVGLLIALRLGQEGIDTLVLEKNKTPHQETRALVYNPIILDPLKSLGVLDAVLREGYQNTSGATWRDIDGKQLGHMRVEGDDPTKFGGLILMGQTRMNALFLNELKKYPSVEILFGVACTGVEQSPSSKTIKVNSLQRSNAEQDVIYEADYLVAADGSNSTIRRCLCVPFEGYTWPECKLVSTHVRYNFAAERGWGPINITVDPLDWSVIALTGEDANGQGCEPEDAVWRVSYGEHPSLPNNKEAIRERAIARVARFTNKGSSFDVVSSDPYYLHQRCAAVAKKGRVLFAGDALHTNNPSGGLGATSGILDAYCYGNALARVIKDGEPDDLLTECSTSRRNVWLTVTNPVTTMNFKRDSYSQDESSKHFRAMFFHKINTDPLFHKVLGEKLYHLLPKGFERPSRADGHLTLEERAEKASQIIGETRISQKRDQKGLPRQFAEVHI